ncbi:hypothetical protein DFR88_08970 [Metallosphaera sedula]|uniref:Transposase n=1 Tax=Metallosphaera prunae TaxID=47304 RepID=A0A4D8S4U1_METPR|nr:hypothetical protein DFR88_08970 [Metallosphaera prunae]
MSALFPSSSHQLCLVHLARNLVRALPEDVGKRAIDLMSEAREKD